MARNKLDPHLFQISPAAFHILLALASGEQHGYRIMQTISNNTGGAFRIGPGSLYGAIKTLLENGWIEETGERPDPAIDDKRRRYYRITSLGRQAAAVEAQRIDQLVRIARASQLLDSPSTGDLQ